MREKNQIRDRSSDLQGSLRATNSPTRRRPRSFRVVREQNEGAMKRGKPLTNSPHLRMKKKKERWCQLTKGEGDFFFSKIVSKRREKKKTVGFFFSFFFISSFLLSFLFLLFLSLFFFYSLFFFSFLLRTVFFFLLL